LLGLPERTELNNGIGKRIPKEKFYSKLILTSAQERMFIDQVSSIRWTNKISPGSMNLSVSDGIQEIEVFEIILKGENVEDKLLKVIDEAIIHPILFVVRNESKERIFISFKETNDAGNTTVRQYYSTEWSSTGSISLDFAALSTGELYKNLTVQISNGLLIMNPDLELSDVVANDIEFQKALKEIEALENKIKKTLQPNKKLDLFHQLRYLKDKWGVKD